jgi:hypothetical protein
VPSVTAPAAAAIVSTTFRCLLPMWRLSGEVACLGIEEYEESGTFGAFWVRKGEVVGALLEGGSAADLAAIEKVNHTCREAAASLHVSLRQCADSVNTVVRALRHAATIGSEA